MRFVRFRPIVLLLAASALVLPSAARAAEIPCADHHEDRLDAMTADGADVGIGFTSEIPGAGLAAGRYALPDDPGAAKTLVVMFHGHGNDTCSWRFHLQDAAEKGAIAVAMDYTGQEKRTWPHNGEDIEVDNYGWFVKEGAADSIKAAEYFKATYPSIERVIAYGISMGGNASGLAVATSDIFDYWIDVEGVNNLVEEYFVARSVAPVNEGAALAVDEIEEENGGSFEEVPEKYLEITNVARAGDMAELDGAIVINGLDDGLVPTDQSPQMTAALTAAGVLTHQYTVLLRGDGESGTTGTGIVAGPLFENTGQGEYESPFAGHGWEGSDTHLVIKTSLDLLWDLIDDGTVEAGETVVPGA